MRDTATLTVREASPGSGTENLQDGMYRVIKFTGALDSNCTVTIAPNTAPAWFIIENATTDSGSSGPYSIILSQGSGANVTVQNGKNAIVYCDGAGSGAAIIDALADLQIGTLEVTGAAAIDGALTVAGASQFNSTITAGVDDTGYDVKFFGATSGKYMLWDESADSLLVAGSSTITTADNTAQLTLVSTDADANAGPILDLWRNSASPADADLLGQIYFYGEDDAGNKQEYSSIKSKAVDVSSGAEKGRFEILNFNAGASKSVLLANSPASNEEIVINEDSADYNFRVESNDVTNMLFVDAGSNTVGVGISAVTSPNTMEIWANNTGTGGVLFVNQYGTGDPAIRLSTQATTYMVGIDNSDSDTFKIDYGTTGVGAQTGFSLNTSGVSSFHDKTVTRLNLKDYGEVTSALGSAGGARTIDLEDGNNFTATVSASTVTWTFSNPTASDELCGFTLFLTNGGSQTVNWPAAVDWAGGTAPTLTESGLDILVFITTDGGTIWHGMVASADSKSPS